MTRSFVLMIMQLINNRLIIIFAYFRVDPLAFAPTEQFKKISITYDDHWFAICLSNKKIYVVKRNLNPHLKQAEGNTVNV